MQLKCVLAAQNFTSSSSKIAIEHFHNRYRNSIYHFYRVSLRVCGFKRDN